MATYSFPQFSVTIVNATVEVLDEIVKYNIETKIGSVNIILTDSVGGSSFGVTLENLDLPTLNAGTVSAKVNIALQDYEV